jgi:hypothetical protein
MTFDKFEEADRDNTRVEIESDPCATEISAAIHGSQQYRYQSSIDRGLCRPHRRAFPLPVLDRLGEEMGRQIGVHAAKTIMQPLGSTSAR